MIVLDASVLIAQFERNDAHHARAVALLDEIVAMPLRASTVTLGEVLVGHVHSGTLDAADHALRRIGVVESPLPARAARRLAELRATTRLKLPDCCVLLAAYDAGADTIATFDDRLAGAARGLGLAVAGA